MRRAVFAAVVLVAGCTSGAKSAPSPSPTTSPPPVRSVTVAPSTTTATAPSTPPPPTRKRATTTPAPSVPPVSRSAQAVGLLDVRTVVPDAILDLRYATPHNFVGVRLYPLDARCLIHRSMASGLRAAAARLRSDGYRLVFWDCYRPHAVQIRMFRVVANPDWVARPGPYARSHEAGRSVDVTLAKDGRELDMGTGFDDFTPRAYAYASDVSAAARDNRARLHRAMQAGGLSVYSGEWWHFDGPGAFVHRPVLDVPVD